MDIKNQDIPPGYVVSQDWLEQRYGAPAAQIILEEIARADQVANDTGRDIKAA